MYAIYVSRYINIQNRREFMSGRKCTVRLLHVVSMERERERERGREGERETERERESSCSSSQPHGTWSGS
jgi:hypothetical protein